MAIELKGHKVWGTGYHRDGEQYGDSDWKDKIKTLISDQDYVIIQGRYGKKSNDFHYIIKGYVFSLLSKDAFLEILDNLNLSYFDDVDLYDAFENLQYIYSKNKSITEKNRYIFISHTATEYQMF